MNQPFSSTYHDGLITLHRDNLNEIFISSNCKCCTNIRCCSTFRFIGYFVTFLSGLFILLLTLPVTGVYDDNPSIFFLVYCLSKILLYVSLLFLASPWKQLFLICRPVRFSTVAFSIVGIIGVWATLLSLNSSLLVLILSIAVQAVSSIFYSLSYLSFTHNVLFDCFKRPSLNRTFKRKRKDDSTSEIKSANDSNEVEQIAIELTNNTTNENSGN
ncbi:Vesicle transport protein [Entamoeba marina]